MFFDREYVFKGKHAKYVIELKNSVFNRNVDILILAPVIGLVYDRKSEIDNSGEFSAVNTSIFAETMTSENEKILFNYRLCMLLSDENTDEEKIDNAFKYYTSDDSENLERFKKNIRLYNSYILGGVEILYELLLKGNKEFNGDPNNEIYKKKVISDVTEFVSDYLEQANEINKISDDIEIGK